MIRRYIQSEWVVCPVCGENDVRREACPEDGYIYHCVNLNCGSNGGANFGGVNLTNPNAEISRIELIDHTLQNHFGGGRFFVEYNNALNIDYSFQDNNSTLKIFFSDREKPSSVELFYEKYKGQRIRYKRGGEQFEGPICDLEWQKNAFPENQIAVYTDEYGFHHVSIEDIYQVSQWENLKYDVS